MQRRQIARHKLEHIALLLNGIFFTLGTQSVAVGGTVNNDFNPLQITWAGAQEGLNNGDWTPSEANSAGSIILGGSSSQIVAAANMPFVTLMDANRVV